MSAVNGTAAGSSPIPKWQLALVVGAPVALGLGYMYYRNNARTNTKPDRRGKSKGEATVKKNGAPVDKQISIDGDVNGQPNQVPSSAAKQPEVKIALMACFFLQTSNRK